MDVIQVTSRPRPLSIPSSLTKLSLIIDLITSTLLDPRNEIQFFIQTIRTLIHLGSTDLPLTQNGVRRMQEAAKALVGEDRLLTTSSITQIYCSPRQRAQQTLKILSLPSTVPVTTTPLLCEWDYGDYE